MTADREESWRSALMMHHLCPSVGQRNHRHGAIDLPAACSEFRCQLLGEKQIEWRLDASCTGRLELRREVRLKSLHEKMSRFGLERSRRKKRVGGGTTTCSPAGRRRCSENPSSTGTWSSDSSDVGASGSEDAVIAAGAGGAWLG
jgi:hypothetical protein